MTPLLPALERASILRDLLPVEPAAASHEQLARVHTPELIATIQRISQRGGGLLDQGDTYVTPFSYELARLAAGSCCAAVDKVLTGSARNGFALVRPPGHHAETSRVSGFCLFNNVAVAARQAQAAHGLDRVAIVDLDVHHGNGTQEIFYADDSVLFVSMHLFAPYFYPGIGSLGETGAGRGHGHTLNVPLPSRVGDAGYMAAMERVLAPRLRAFAPQLLLVSIGFDAHWLDPLATAGLSLTGYAALARELIRLAGDLCDGRILFVLEGGYQHDVLTIGVANTFHALLGNDNILDPFGPMAGGETDIEPLLVKLQAVNLSN